MCRLNIICKSPYMIQIGSLYCLSSFSMLSKWKQWSNQLTRLFLTVEPSLAKQGLKTSRSILRHQTTVFGDKLCRCSATHFCSYSIHRDLSNDARIASIEVCMWKLCHLEVDLLVFSTIIREEAMSTPIIYEKGASHVTMM